MLAPVYTTFLRCVNLAFETIPEKNEAICNAIRCERYHAHCFLDYFDMHCGLCVWFLREFGPTGDLSRFNSKRLEGIFLSYCQDFFSSLV